MNIKKKKKVIKLSYENINLIYIIILFHSIFNTSREDFP